MRHLLFGRSGYSRILIIIGSVLFINGCGYNDKIYIPNEVTVFVELRVNESKSVEEIKEFATKYQEFVDSTESNSLGWSYHQSGDEVILIERYKNEDANIITAENISPGGQRYELMQEQLEYFTVEKVSVYGPFTDKLIDFNTMTAEKVGLTATFEYNPLISGYSRSSRWEFAVF